MAKIKLKPEDVALIKDEFLMETNEVPSPHPPVSSGGWVRRCPQCAVVIVLICCPAMHGCVVSRLRVRCARMAATSTPP